MNIKDCFKEDFTEWLLKSNNPSVNEKESLREILDILLREPLADYFWYSYPEHGGRLSYSLPHYDVLDSVRFDLLKGKVLGDTIRVDKDKIKAFLRNYKIESILN